MKAQVNSVPVEYLRGRVDNSSGVGKVQKKGKKDETESREIKAYLNKLQELVPFTPKNKKLSKLEVISYVIDYIQDLRETLGLPPSPCQNGSDHLDEQFTWMVKDSSSSSSAVVHDDFCQHEEDSSSSIVPPSPTTLTAATITVTSTISNASSSEFFQHNRQPLCVISNPRGNTHSAQNHLATSSNSVKSTVVLASTSASTNCGHQLP